MCKRLVIENWYRFMNEDTGDNPIDKLLKDMEEEDPEAYSAMQAELEEFDVDPNEITPDQLYKVFDKYAAEKETDLMTNRGTNPFDFDQKSFNKRFDVTGDGKFNLNDVLELGNKSIPYGIYFGSYVTGGRGLKDKNVSTKNATVKALNAPGVFKGIGEKHSSQSTAPYIIVYMIPTTAGERFFIFDPTEAFSMARKNTDTSDPMFGGDTEMSDYSSKKAPKNDIVISALKLCYNFIPAMDFFSYYSQEMDDELSELTRMTAKTSISIKLIKNGQKSILGKMMIDAGIHNEYAYATDLEVKLGGSFSFSERMDDLLFALDSFPMLLDVTFVIRGVMTGGQQKELMSMLEKHKPFYNYKIESAFFEENSLMEDYKITQQIKRVKNGR